MRVGKHNIPRIYIYLYTKWSNFFIPLFVIFYTYIPSEDNEPSNRSASIRRNQMASSLNGRRLEFNIFFCKLSVSQMETIKLREVIARDNNTNGKSVCMGLWDVPNGIMLTLSNWIKSKEEWFNHFYLSKLTWLETLTYKTKTFSIVSNARQLIYLTRFLFNHKKVLEMDVSCYVASQTKLSLINFTVLLADVGSISNRSFLVLNTFN